MQITVQPDAQESDLSEEQSAFIASMGLSADNKICQVVLQLDIVYPEDYPQILPEFSLTPIEGALKEQEITDLLASIRTVVCGWLSCN